jgi:hypothetical protein
MQNIDFEESWQIVREELPSDLEQRARKNGFVRRMRGFDSVEILTRLLLMHGSGLSLEQTALRAREHGLANISAVALHERLKASRGFFAELCQFVQSKMRDRLGERPWPEGWKLRAIDATEVSEPGPTGSTWRVHYSLRLPELVCDHFELSDTRAGETLRRWKIAPDEVVLADRAYSHRQGISELLKIGANFVVRLNTGLFPLENVGGKPLDLGAMLQPLREGKPRSWKVFFASEAASRSLRLCAMKKSPQAAALARKRARRRAQRDGSTIQEQTLLFADYVLVLTSLGAEHWPDRSVLDLYRCRWQVELAFKRLKSLLQLGHLPKKDPSTAQAWMHLKLLLALLIEELLFEAKFIFPWGYNLRPDQPLARV